MDVTVSANSSAHGFAAFPTAAASARPAAVSDSKLSWQEQKEREAARRKKENALKRCEDQIAKLEERDKAIDEEMALPEVATSVSKLQALSKEKDEIAEKLMELMEQWEELSE